MTVNNAGDNLSATETVVSLAKARSFWPLAVMSDSHLQQLLASASVSVVLAGQLICSPGAGRQREYFLLHGELDQRPQRAEYTLALNYLQPADCSVRAATDCRVLIIDSERLRRLLCWSQVADYLLLDMTFEPDWAEDIEWMSVVLRSNLFLKVPPLHAWKIFSGLQAQVVDSGDVILRQGEIGDYCYFIKEGAARVSRSADGIHRSEWLADIGVGRCFGEDALVNDTLRNATVSMASNGVLMTLAKADFLALLIEPEVTECSTQALQGLCAEPESGQKPGLASAVEIKLALLIDVRTEGEYLAGHLRRAINIPLGLLRLMLPQFEAKQELVVYCDCGARSRAAAYLLAEQGFKCQVLAAGVVGMPASERQAYWQRDKHYLLSEGRVIESSPV